MNKLQLRKRALILESDLNRLALQSECRNLRSALTWFRPTMHNRSWLLALAPVAGFLVVRLLRRREPTASGLGSVLQWLPALFSLWRGFKAASSKG